jgi:hypothetical protein
MSIRNIISFIRIINGTKGTEVKFYRFPDAATYLIPWNKGTGILNTFFDFILNKEHIIPKDEKSLMKLFDGDGIENQ